MAESHDARLVELVEELGGDDVRFLFRDLVQKALQELIDAELTQAIGAGPHERTETRTNHRNGARSRVLSTPAGDVELRIPKVREGAFFPSLLEPRRRVDRALWAVIMTAYVTGTSTRKVDDLVKALGVESGISKSTVSRICEQLDEAILVTPLALLGFFLAPKAGSSRDRQRHGGGQEPRDWAASPILPPAPNDHEPGLEQTRPSVAAPQLVFGEGSESTVAYDVRVGTAVVGRGSAADLQLDDTFASTRHAALDHDGSQLQVTDLGSTNGTMRNGQPLNGWVGLQHGDEIQFGSSVARVRFDGERPLPSPQAPAPRQPARAPGAGAGWRSVFISYASEDRDLVERISDALRSDGWTVWFDQHSLEPGAQWGRRISSAIAESSVVLAVISPATLGSQWVDAELQLAHRRNRPILGAVVEWTDPQAIDDRLGLYLNRHRMDLGQAGLGLAAPAVEQLSLALDTLARGASTAAPAAGLKRTGSLILAVGVVAMAASLVWLIAQFGQALSGIGGFFDVLGEPGIASEAESFTAWRRGADAIIGTWYVMPALIASAAIIGAGLGVRRSARRKVLQGV